MSEYALFDEELDQETQETQETQPEPPQDDALTAAAPQQEWASELRGLRNLTDDTMRFPVEPWNFVTDAPAEALKSKESWSKWAMTRTTEHLFFTGMEALNPLLRANKDNPVVKVHAIVIDYDGNVTDDNIAAISGKLSPDLMPTWACKTRWSGGCRLVWMFEHPLDVGHGNLVDSFLKQANSVLRFNQLAAGFDPQSLKTTQTFEVGVDWRRIGGPLRDEAVQSWLFKACLMRDSKLDVERGAFRIPIRDVAAEVERQFPGRWGGDFEVGRRGVVFFDPTSVNPSASIVTEDGMVCFGQAKSFYPWREILGAEFVRQYEENQISNATTSLFFDGSEAWRRNFYNPSRWERLNMTSLDAHLTVECGLKDEALKKAKFHIDRYNRIRAAVPFVGNNQEIVTNAHGDRLLNTRCHQKVVQPAPGHSAGWGDGFSFLAEFFDTRHDTDKDPNGFSKWHLLSWWSIFYKGILNGDLDLGQAIAIVGGAGTGKTLFVKRMLSPSVGGTSNAGTYLKGLTLFNADLFESAVWLVDDDALTQDPATRDRFSKMLKACASTDSMEYIRKGKDPVPVEWTGRAVILLNSDPESILSIPSLNISNNDKFCLYRWREHGPEFMRSADLEATVARELPFLLRWLVEMKPEDYGVQANSRFGIASYIESETAAEAERASGAGSFQEIITELVKEQGLTGIIDVNPVMFLSRLSSIEQFRQFAHKLTPQSVGKQFRVLASMPNHIVSRSSLAKGMWSIDCDRIRKQAGFIERAPSTVDLSK